MSIHGDRDLARAVAFPGTPMNSRLKGLAFRNITIKSARSLAADKYQ